MCAISWSVNRCHQCRSVPGYKYNQESTDYEVKEERSDNGRQRQTYRQTGTLAIDRSECALLGRHCQRSRLQLVPLTELTPVPVGWTAAATAVLVVVVVVAWNTSLQENTLLKSSESEKEQWTLHQQQPCQVPIFSVIELANDTDRRSWLTVFYWLLRQKVKLSPSVVANFFLQTVYRLPVFGYVCNYHHFCSGRLRQRWTMRW